MHRCGVHGRRVARCPERGPGGWRQHRDSTYAPCGGNDRPAPFGTRGEEMKPAIPPETIKALPDTPGVYLFYGTLGELLYVGKSKTIRTRVRSHFSAPEEKGLTRRIRRIEARPTAGELGALLLESQLIKELRPMFNVASRRRRRVMVSRRLEVKRRH